MIIDSFFQKRGIRKVVFWFAVSLSLILFQTPVMQLGTISSLATIGLYFFYYQSSSRIKSPSIVSTATIFITQAFLITLLLCNYNPDIWKFLLLSLMFVSSFSIQLSEKEYQFVRFTFVASMSVYAILIIYSMITQPDRLYFHDSIELFGTYFDCNFVGVPIVAASVVSLDYVMDKKNFLFIAPFLLFGYTIVMTASRGSLVGFGVASGLYFLTFLKESKLSTFRKMLLITAVSAVVIYSVVHYIIPNLEDQVNRITNFGDNADNGRFDLWKKGLEVFEANFLLGGGLWGTYDYCGHANHNTYMQVLSSTGIIGSLLFLYLVIYLLKSSYRKDFYLFCMLCGFFTQIAFLDTLTGRFIWPILSFVVMAPYNKTTYKTK